MSLVFIGFSVIHFLFLKSFFFKLISILFTLITIISGVLTLILNPGIIYNLKNEGINSENKIYCFQCRFQYPHLNMTLTHCENCGVCYVERDHHCDVFGKCVAKNNLFIFTIFAISVCFLIVVNFSSIGFLISPQKK